MGRGSGGLVTCLFDRCQTRVTERGARLVRHGREGEGGGGGGRGVNGERKCEDGVSEGTRAFDQRAFDCRGESRMCGRKGTSYSPMV